MILGYKLWFIKLICRVYSLILWYKLWFLKLICGLKKLDIIESLRNLYRGWSVNHNLGLIKLIRQHKRTVKAWYPERLSWHSNWWNERIQSIVFAYNGLICPIHAISFPIMDRSYNTSSCFDTLGLMDRSNNASSCFDTLGLTQNYIIMVDGSDTAPR